MARYGRRRPPKPHYGYPPFVSPVYSGGGAHPVVKITQPISFGAMSMRRYGSFAGKIATVIPPYNPGVFSTVTEGSAFSTTTEGSVFSERTNSATFGSAD